MFKAFRSPVRLALWLAAPSYGYHASTNTAGRPQHNRKTEEGPGRHAASRRLGSNDEGPRRDQVRPEEPRLHTRPAPARSGGPAEVLIRVRYADLNPVDLHKLRARPDGTPAPPHRSPLVVGFGGSGTVVAAGEDGEDGRDASAAAAAAKARDLVGKDVCFLADPGRDGSYAEYVVCDARLVCAVPPGVDMARAACVPVAGCTAFECLDKVGLPVGRGGSAGVEEGKRKRLLIVGGSGGVGSWTTQLARATYGGSIEIICTVGSPESAEWCTRMGADRTVPHDGIDERLDAGPGGSVDAVICLSEPTRRLFDSLAGVLRPFGRICLVVAGDAIRSLDLSFVFFKSGTVSTETVFSSIRCGYHLDQAGEMATILEAMSAGSVRAPLSDDWSEDVSGWEEANGEGGLIDKLDGGHTRGKYTVLFEAFSLWPPDPRPRLRFLALALEVHRNRLHQSPHKAGQAVRGHEHRRRAHTAARTGASEAGRGGDGRRRPPRKRRRKDRPPGPPRAPSGRPPSSPPRRRREARNPAGSPRAAGDEFDGLLDDDVASESDALLVLQSYTSPPSGSCGLCPILRPGAVGAGSTVECVPFLTRRVLLRLLTAGPSPSAAGAEAQVREMMRDGRAVGMQLLGTADGGDGNDPDDVAVIEAGAYLHAAGGALADRTAGRGGRGATSPGNGAAVEWIGEVLIPALRGRPYLPSDELEGLDACRVEELLEAGLLTPRPADIGGG
ncbi:hypothetical protein THAOC_05530, partial [Thalassiosira oceanica]